ncbi:hypothetical protein IT575_07415 [bacterium]|nr:hypothetical protein [bacterium]
MQTYGILARTALALCAGSLLALVSCGGGDGGSTTPPVSTTNPEDLIPEIQVQTVDHLFRTGSLSAENLDSDPIFNLIASATSTLDVAVTRIDRQAIVEALLNEARSGVNVRIVTEKAFYDDPVYKAFYNQLEDTTLNGGNLEIRTDEEGEPRLMQSRFLVIDQARVVTGSYNWESSGAESTFGDVINILNTGVAAAFTNQFNQMFVEGNFGVHKRDDTQHSFLVGGGRGTLEVYFGPTDRTRELIQNEIQSSNNVIFAAQQYKDFALANFMLSWLGSSADNTMAGLFNDVAFLGDDEENQVYLAFVDYLTTPTGGPLYINGLIDSGNPASGGQFANYNTMNHKMLFTNHGLTDNRASVITSTANYTDLGFTINDQVTLIFRGNGLVNKFIRGIDYSRPLPPTNLREPDDSQEFDQLMTMYPYGASTGAPFLRDISRLPCALIYGSVTNFNPTVTIQNQNSTGGNGGVDDIIEVDIDLYFGIEVPQLFFGGSFPDPDVDATFEDVDGNTLYRAPLEDPFIRSELVNPDHRYMMVVPAGEVIIHTFAESIDSGQLALFEPTERRFSVGPGAVKEVNLIINQAFDDSGNVGGGQG